jgi:CYTH domain-containing protein
MVANDQPPAQAEFGSPAGKYARFELERRFLVDRLPDGLGEGHLIVDRYIAGSSLRLRRVESRPPQYKLTQKQAPVPPDYATTTITNIYLSAAEYELLTVLPGQELRKRRHRLGQYSIDVFEGELEGLILAEASFTSEGEMRTHAAPGFAVREVSADIRYTGGRLATQGLPR